jgi:ubiquinone/menaquinone biosynthesis C-methylase UbiE
MSASPDHARLKDLYEQIALSRDEKTTACDFNLRELEIDTGAAHMRDGDTVLDVGCGLGYALRQYAARKNIRGFGIDYAANMVGVARELQREYDATLRGTVEFRQASVLELPFADATFDVVTSSRCLMALLDWERQKSALVEIARVLKPGGTLVLMEGTFEGLERLNEARAKFGLAAIDASGRERLQTLKFHEADLLAFCSAHYDLQHVQRFGTYYFLSRVVHPLLAAPEPPRYDAPINAVALEIARKIPDFMGLGHLVAFILRKPPRAA